MKVAALYDVHGMPWTLEAALADVDDADEIVFGGDLLGGPYPERVVELARSVDARFVRGNSEREPSERDRERVPAEQLAWLAGLPLTESLDEAKVRDWLTKGAQPTEPVARLLKVKGIR